MRGSSPPVPISRKPCAGTAAAARSTWPCPAPPPDRKEEGALAALRRVDIYITIADEVPRSYLSGAWPPVRRRMDGRRVPYGRSKLRQAHLLLPPVRAQGGRTAGQAA